MGEVKPFRLLRGSGDNPDSASTSSANSQPSSSSPDNERLSSLVVRSGRGDEAAFAALYDELSGLIYGLVLRVVRNPAQAEEVAQEVFVEIWRHAPRYEAGRGSVKSWSASIAHRRAVDRVRSEQSARNREDKDHATEPEPHDATAEELADRFQIDRVRKAMENLTEVQRAAIELAYFGGHTYREVAVLLDIAEGTAKTRIRDGLIRLRDHLGVTS